MRAGKLDKLVRIERRSRTRDPGSGELVETWAPLGPSISAELIEGRPLERYAASQKIAEITAGWRMRYAPALLTLTPDLHRITYGALVYDVKGATEIQRRQGVVVLCAARTEGLTALGQEPEA